MLKNLSLPPLPMHVVYSLRNDTENLAHMQAASKSSGDTGLKITHGLVGTDEWWTNVSNGSIRKVTVSGKVSGFWPGHYGDFPEFELREELGKTSKWGCFVSAATASAWFQPGTAVEVEYVIQELKQPFAGDTETQLVIAIRVA